MVVRGRAFGSVVVLRGRGHVAPWWWRKIDALNSNAVLVCQPERWLRASCCSLRNVTNNALPEALRIARTCLQGRFVGSCTWGLDAAVRHVTCGQLGNQSQLRSIERRQMKRCMAAKYGQGSGRRARRWRETFGCLPLTWPALGVTQVFEGDLQHGDKRGWGVDLPLTAAGLLRLEARKAAEQH